MSHQSLILYLFLILVGDSEGRSFYGERTIMEILRLNNKELYHARQELLKRMFHCKTNTPIELNICKINKFGDMNIASFY